jgi:CheY-like chemotaxis protein
MSHYPRRLLPAIANEGDTLVLAPVPTFGAAANPHPQEQAASSQAVVSQAGSKAATATTRLRILLVEDSPTQAAVITSGIFQAFSQSQLTILRVPTLTEARELSLPAGQHEGGGHSNPNLGMAGPLTFDLIILDVSLPDGSGYELCRALKANPATARVPVVMFSDRSLADLGEAALEAGANYCISKDSSGGEQTLLMLLASLLEQHRLPQPQPEPQPQPQAQTTPTTGLEKA